MTDPDTDDGWGDLARELGLEKSAQPADEPPTSPARPAAASPHEDELDDAGEGEGAEAELDDEEAESEGAEVEGTGGEEQPGDGQPGPGRKRRRRRRRRKKGGPGQPGAEEGTEVGDAGEPAEEPAPVRAAPAEVADDEFGYSDEEAEAEEVESEGAGLAAEEDTGGELLRELIATWNVPAWDEIIGGLYRPER